MQLAFLGRYFLDCCNLNMNFKSSTVNAFPQCPILPNAFDCGLFLISNCMHGSKSWFDETNVCELSTVFFFFRLSPLNVQL